MKLVDRGADFLLNLLMALAADGESGGRRLVFVDLWLLLQHLLMTSVAVAARWRSGGPFQQHRMTIDDCSCCLSRNWMTIDGCCGCCRLQLLCAAVGGDVGVGGCRDGRTHTIGCCWTCCFTVAVFAQLGEAVVCCCAL